MYERPAVLPGYTPIIQSGCGKLHITVNFDGARPIEVYVKTSSSGGCVANVEALGRLISKSLQGGIPISEILNQLHSIRCVVALRSTKTKYKIEELDPNKEIQVKSCADDIAWAIETAMSMRGTTWDLCKTIPQGGCENCTTRECGKPKI